MALEDFSEDYLKPEVGIVVAALAMVLSPPVRGALRRGAVYGLAGMLKAGGAIGALAHRVEQGVQPSPVADFAQVLAEEARNQRATQTRAAPEQN